MPLPVEEIAFRVGEIRARIEDACGEAGRNPDDVTLVAVAKGHSVASVRAAVAAGVTDCAENYLHELAVKTSAVSEARWHFQGALQRRKIKEIVNLTDSILSVARKEELDEIQKRAERTIACYIEVNIGREPSKHGVMPEELGALVDASLRCSRIRIDGLMVIPPPSEEPPDHPGLDARRWFDEAARLAEMFNFDKLSMGMSDDFEEAVKAGSTMVRIGTSIFGPRDSQ